MPTMKWSCQFLTHHQVCGQCRYYLTSIEMASQLVKLWMDTSLSNFHRIPVNYMSQLHCNWLPFITLLIYDRARLKTWFQNLIPAKSLLSDKHVPSCCSWYNWEKMVDHKWTLFHLTVLLGTGLFGNKRCCCSIRSEDPEGFHPRCRLNQKHCPVCFPPKESLQPLPVPAEVISTSSYHRAFLHHL